MARVLIAFGTWHGHTAKIVDHLAGQLRIAGHEVAVRSVLGPIHTLLIGASDAIVIAAPVYFGRHGRAVREFVRGNRAALASRPSGFVSVSGAIGGAWDRGPATAQRYLDDFRARTGWTPSRSLSVAGALRYTRYDLLTRWMMKAISARTRRPTDTSRDHDLTDWDDVNRFAAELAGLLDAAAAGTTVPL